MKKVKKIIEAGFTLVELVIVIVILSILASIAIPRFIHISTLATNAVKTSSINSVKSGFSIYIAQNQGGYPTVTQLADTVHGKNVSHTVSGIQLDIGGTTYLVKTFQDSDCSTPNDGSAIGSLVHCVSGIIP